MGRQGITVRGYKETISFLFLNYGGIFYTAKIKSYGNKYANM